MASTGTKRKCSSFDTQLKLIEAVEKGDKSKAEICREHGIAARSLSTILKDCDKIRTAVEQGTCQHQKQQTSLFPDMDKALLVWFKQTRAKNALISALILKEKGEELAEELGYTNCELSGRWLDRFKLRHGIVFKTVSREAASAIDIETSAWEKTLKKILTDFSPRDIFNTDETDLFNKCLPNKSLAFQGEGCSSQKVPKERVSILCAANMDGSEKLPLLLIGKFSQPRCFQSPTVTVDETIATSGEMSVADIASTIRHTDGEEEDAADEDTAMPPVTSKAALPAMEQVRTHVMQQVESGAATKALQLENCVQEMAKQAKKQSTIDQFFSRAPQKQ